MRIFRNSLSLVVLFVLLFGCRQKEEIKVYRVAREGSADAMNGPPADPHAGLPGVGSAGTSLPPGHPTTPVSNRVTGEVPSNWETGRVSSMRQASFLAKGTAGETADISLVILRGTAGGLLKNVNRWRGELGQGPVDAAGLEEIVKSLTTALGEAVVVDLEGLGDGADPAMDGRTVAAVVSQPAETWFFKMRGNAALVGTQEQEFLDWVASVQPAEGEAAAPVGPVAGGDPNPAPPAGEDRGLIKWQVPAGWIEGPPKSMRVVTFAVTGPGAIAGEVTVVKLAGTVGGSLANLNRWCGQIGLPPIEAGQLGSLIEAVPGSALEMSKIELAGPEASTVAAWAIHEGASWYFKLTGPASLVEAEQDRFTEFLKSIEFVAK